MRWRKNVSLPTLPYRRRRLFSCLREFPRLCRCPSDSPFSCLSAACPSYVGRRYRPCFLCPAPLPSLVVVTGSGPDVAGSFVHSSVRRHVPPHRCNMDCARKVSTGHRRRPDLPIPTPGSAGSNPSAIGSVWCVPLRCGHHLCLPLRLLDRHVRHRLCRSCVGFWWSWVRPVPTSVAPPNLVAALSTVVTTLTSSMRASMLALDGADPTSTWHVVEPSTVIVRLATPVSAIAPGSPSFLTPALSDGLVQ
jgi:hypothetical protein